MPLLQSRTAPARPPYWPCRQDKQAVNSFFLSTGPASLAFVYQVVCSTWLDTSPNTFLPWFNCKSWQAKEDRLKDGSIGPVENKPTLHRLGPVCCAGHGFGGGYCGSLAKAPASFHDSRRIHTTLFNRHATFYRYTNSVFHGT